MQDHPGNRFKDLFIAGRRGHDKKPHRIALNKRVIIFLFFLFLSIIFWFLTVLNKNYETILTYPVRYINFPTGKALVNDVPDRLSLTVNARGFTLLRYKLQSKLVPIIFNVNSFSLNTIQGKEPLTMYIITNYAIDKIEQQLSSEMSLVSISPDTLFFQFASVDKKNVPVKANLKLGFLKQFMQVGPIVIDPDSTIISGPKVLVDTINCVYTQSQEFTGLKKDVETRIKIQPIDKIKFASEEIMLRIPVDKFTEGVLKIPIEVVNVPDSLYLRTFPSQIELTYQVGLRDFEKVNEHMFNAQVDYLSIENNIGTKLKVSIITAPEYVQIANYSPKNVEYILEK